MNAHREKLITLTPDQRLKAARLSGNPVAGDAAEEQANQQVRLLLFQVAELLEIALRHPLDVDCARLVRAVRAVTQADEQLAHTPTVN